MHKIKARTDRVYDPFKLFYSSRPAHSPLTTPHKLQEKAHVHNVSLCSKHPPPSTCPKVQQPKLFWSSLNPLQNTPLTAYYAQHLHCFRPHKVHPRKYTHHMYSTQHTCVHLALNWHGMRKSTTARRVQGPVCTTGPT